MVYKRTNDHLEAFNAIVSRLSEFDEDTQRHILSSVSNWLGFSDASQTIGSTAAPTQTESSTSQSSSKGFMVESEQSPKEFLMEKEPNTNVERVACLAYYLTHYRGIPHFKTLDISKLNTEAAQPKFTNPTVAMNDTAISGMVVTSTKGAKQLSAMGEQFVLALPNRVEAKKIRKRMRSKRRKKPTGQKITTSNVKKTRANR